MIHKQSSASENKVIVTFEIPGSIWADQIYLVGDFNGWDPHNLPFHYNRQENWEVQLELDEGQEYRFRYLIDDDNWGSEWQADRDAVGPDGAHDSVVIAQVQQAT
jgi:1,4-alpha-glucan branching enzyme